MFRHDLFKKFKIKDQKETEKRSKIKKGHDGNFNVVRQIKRENIKKKQKTLEKCLCSKEMIINLS